MATATPDRHVLERFNDVQVYFHGALATSIFLLWLTGLPLTFNGPLGWLIAVFGHTNVVMVHVAAGVTLVASSLFFVAYALLGVASGETSLLSVLPRPRDVPEAVQQFKFVAGFGDAPDSEKYTFLQKAEIWIISFEVVVMSATGLLLWYRGVLDPVSPNPPMLILRDVHAVVAVTMLVGVVFHLFMTHVKEAPIDLSMFTGTVGVGRACEEWTRWAEREVGTSDVPCEESSRATVLTTGMVLAMLLFVVIWTGAILRYVLSPLPTGPRLLADTAPNALPDGAVGAAYLVGLNLVAFVIVAGLAALGYGFYRRVTDEPA